jgi:hypothetical protein
MNQLTIEKGLDFFEKLVLRDYSPDEAQRIIQKRRELDKRLLDEILLSDKSRT